MYDSTGSARVPVGRGVQLAAVEELLTDEEVEAVYDLTRTLMHQAAQRTDTPPERDQARRQCLR